MKGTASNSAKRCSLNLIEGEGYSRTSDVNWKAHYPPILLQHVMCEVRCTSIYHSSVPISRRQEKKGSSVPLWHCTDSEMALPSKKGVTGDPADSAAALHSRGSCVLKKECAWKVPERLDSRLRPRLGPGRLQGSDKSVGTACERACPVSPVAQTQSRQKCTLGNARHCPLHMKRSFVFLPSHRGRRSQQPGC